MIKRRGYVPLLVIVGAFLSILVPLVLVSFAGPEVQEAIANDNGVTMFPVLVLVGVLFLIGSVTKIRKDGENDDES